MTRKIRRGHIAKDVEILYIRLCLMGGSELEFKNGIKRLLLANSPLGNVIFHDVAATLRKQAVDYKKVADMERIWELTDQVDKRIRAAWNKYENDFSWKLS